MEIDIEFLPPKCPVKIGPGFVFSILERALYEGLSRRDFGKTQMKEVAEFFGGPPVTCVYCGRPAQRWDHLVPIREGGETVIGNMVPACARCDDSKQDMSVEEWWKSSRRYSPLKAEVKDHVARLARLRAYAEHFDYRPRKLEERLTSEEAAKLQRIREAAAILRNEFESLVTTYRQRTEPKDGQGERRRRTPPIERTVPAASRPARRSSA